MAYIVIKKYVIWGMWEGLSRRSLWEVKWAYGLSWGHVVLSHRLVKEVWVRLKKLCIVAVNCIWEGFLGDKNWMKWCRSLKKNLVAWNEAHVGVTEFVVMKDWMWRMRLLGVAVHCMWMKLFDCFGWNWNFCPISIWWHLFFISKPSTNKCKSAIE